MDELAWYTCVMSFLKKRVPKEKHLELPTDSRNMHCRVVTDLFESDDAIQSWRIFRIMAEFVEGFELLRKYSTAATFFGSARSLPADPYYKAAEALASELAKARFAIITGGGGGIMEAANVGAFKVGGSSIGLNIKLPMEQHLNSYVTESKSFHFFFSRKVMLSFASEVYIYFPGGYGTLDELFELLTLVQTNKIARIPIVLYGKEFWSPLIKYMETALRDEYATISPEDLDLFYLVDSVDEAVAYITKNVPTDADRQR